MGPRLWRQPSTAAGLRAAAILLPLMVATFLSILSTPLLTGLLRRRVPKFVAVPFTALANLAVLAGLILAVAGSANAFTASLPKYRQRLEAMANSTVQWLQSVGVDASELRWLESWGGAEPPEGQGEGGPDGPGGEEGDELGRGTEWPWPEAETDAALVWS